MPTYDYRCERTGELFELWQSFSDDALTECPQTHADGAEPCGAPVKKVFSKVGISFKGEGFYKNDHGTSAKPAAEKAPTDSPKETPKETPKTDSSSPSSSTKPSAD